MKESIAPVGSKIDEQELWLRGEEIEQRIAYSESVYEDPALTRFLQSVVDNLVDEYPIAESIRPRVMLLNSNEMNAFALPHGALYFTLGLIDLLEFEAEFAIVAAHELTHFLNRHALSVNREISNRETRSIIGTIMLAGLGGAVAGQAGGRALGSLSHGSMQTWRLAAVSGYSRELETEADTEALQMAAEAGYDVSVAPQIFSRLQQNIPVSDEETTYYATHPALADREAHYRDLVRNMPVHDASNSSSQEDFQSYTDSIVHQLVRLCIEDKEYDRGKASLEKFLSRHEVDAEALYLLAEITRLQNEPIDDVIAAYKVAVRAPDPEPMAWRELGLVLRAAGIMDESAAALRNYIALRPDGIEVPLFRRYIDESSLADFEE